MPRLITDALSRPAALPSRSNGSPLFDRIGPGDPTLLSTKGRPGNAWPHRNQRPRRCVSVRILVQGSPGVSACRGGGGAHLVANSDSASFRSENDCVLQAPAVPVRPQRVNTEYLQSFAPVSTSCTAPARRSEHAPISRAGAAAGVGRRARACACVQMCYQVDDEEAGSTTWWHMWSRELRVVNVR